MKNLPKMLLLVAVAVSVSWAGSWLVGRGPPTMVELQDAGAGLGPPSGKVPGGSGQQNAGQDDAAQPPASQPPADGAGADPASGGKVVIPDVTQAEIDAAMDEVDKTLAGRGRDAGEAVAEAPLPADLAIALPSDI